ncbi:MAG: hypothetical protein OHK0029_19650 [Armatimonadaceae bacterium]
MSPLSEHERRQMLYDIAHTALAIGRDLYPNTPLQDLDLGAGSSPDICPRERLQFLASVWEKVAKALHRIEQEPPGALVPSTRESPVERARLVCPKDILTALRRGEFVPADRDRSPLAAKLNGKLPRRVVERASVPTFDTPANRMVKTVLATWVRDLTGIADLATVSDAPTVAGEAFRLRRNIRQALCHAPWRTLPLAPHPVLPIGLRTHGVYRLFWDTWRQYRAGFSFDWRNPLFSLPSREDWLLYEYWCLFQVGAALQRLGFCVQEAEGFRLLRSGLTFTLVRGKASAIRLRHPATRTTVTLTYNREFPPELSRAPLFSVSHAMRPDITVEQGNRLLILDAKFKGYAPRSPRYREESEDGTNLPLTTDINQMHAYRDGIRDRRGNRAVCGAWLLYVGEQHTGNLPVIAYPAASPEAPFGNGAMGAILLRPGRATTVMDALFHTVLLRDGLPDRVFGQE